jgi:Holliday junction resolvase
MSTNRNTDFTKRLLEGYTRANEIRTAAFLGDRSTYVGLSEAAKAFGCLRAAVADRVQPMPKYPSLAALQLFDDSAAKTALERIRPLERGHEQESGLASAFAALGLNVLRQLEICVEHEGVPIHAHLDFVLFHDDMVEVVESKSNESIPDVLYVEYEAQIHGQVGLLQRFSGQPVFTLRDEDGVAIFQNQTLEAIARQRFGKSYADSTGQIPAEKVRGTLLSMSANDVEAFGPYSPNAIMTNAILSRAAYIWNKAADILDGVASLNDVEHVFGFYILCDYCAHNAHCPKFVHGGRASHEAEQSVLALQDLKDQIKALDEKANAIKEHLANVYDGQNLPAKSYLDGVDHRFRHCECQRKTLDEKQLKQTLMLDQGMSEETVNSIIETSKKVSTFMKLDISKINRPAKAAA